MPSMISQYVSISGGGSKVIIDGSGVGKGRFVGISGVCGSRGMIIGSFSGDGLFGRQVWVPSALGTQKLSVGQGFV